MDTKAAGSDAGARLLPPVTHLPVPAMGHSIIVHDEKAIQATAAQIPMFNITTKEIWYHRLTKALLAYSYISGLAGSMVEWVAEVSALMQVSFLAAIGVGGVMIGAVLAYWEVRSEQDKIMRLNKELFVLLNMASDIYDKLLDAKDGTKEREALVQQYDNAINTILSGIASRGAVRESDINEQRERKRVRDLKKIDETDRRFYPHVLHSKIYAAVDYIVREYCRDRKRGAASLMIWKALCENDRFFQNATQLADGFMQYHTREQIEDYFTKQHRVNVKKFNACIVEIDKALADDPSVDRGWREALQGIVNDVIECRDDEVHSNEAKLIAHYRTLHRFSRNDSSVYSGMNDLLDKLVEITSTIIDDNINKKMLLDVRVLNNVPQVFEETGSFRQFCRALQGRKIPTLGGGFAFCDLELLANRTDRSTDRSTRAVLFVGAFAGLLSTCDSFYDEIIAMGYNALWLLFGKFNLLTFGIAALLTLAGYRLFNTTSKIQNTRSDLNKQMETSRNNLAKDMIRSVGLFASRSSGMPVPDDSVLAAMPAAGTALSSSFMIDVGFDATVKPGAAVELNLIRAALQ